MATNRGKKRVGDAANVVTRKVVGLAENTPQSDTQNTAAIVTQKRRYKPRARACACGCGQRFTPTARRPKQRFASDACRQRGYRARQPKRARRSPGSDWYTCECCQEKYVGIVGKGRKYCSPLCKRAAARARRDEAVTVLATALNLSVDAARDVVDVHGMAAARRAAQVLASKSA